jgi:hypothetical protein
MNSSSSISAFVSPVVAAGVYTRFGSFDAMLMSAGVVYLIASLLWLKIDATQSLTSASVEVVEGGELSSLCGDNDGQCQRDRCHPCALGIVRLLLPM